MPYLTIHSTHLWLHAVGYIVKGHSDREREGKKEGNVLFNDTLNTFMVTWCLIYSKGPLR